MRPLKILLTFIFCSLPLASQVNPHTQIRWPLNCAANGMVYSFQLNQCLNMNAISPASQITWPVNCSTPGAVYNLQTNSCLNMNAIDPASQITWPVNCSTPGAVYNLQTNTCLSINAINSGSQVVWPASCTTGTVYSPFSNTCVATGTAANPAGTTGQLQFNNGGFFGGAAGVTFSGGNLNVNVPLVGAASSFTAATASTSFQGPILDKGGQVFNVRAYGAKGDGTTDDTAAFVAAITAAATATGSVAFCPSGIYSISTIAITSAMAGSGIAGPVHTYGGSKGCTLKARGTGFLISNYGDNTGTSHPAIFKFSVNRLNFDGQGVSLGGIFLDYVIFPDISFNSFTGFAACAQTNGLNNEPCGRAIKLSASQYCNIHDNIFTGNGYAIDGQFSFTSRPAAGSYGCNDLHVDRNILSANMGVRNSGDTGFNANDIEVSLQSPAVADIDCSDTTSVLFYCNVYDNYTESTTQFRDATHLNYADNVFVRCGSQCIGLTVTNNQRIYGNNYLAGSKAVWIDSSPYVTNIAGNAFAFWETPVFQTAGKQGPVTVGFNTYVGTVPQPTAVQPTLTLNMTSGALTSISFSGATSGAYASTPFVRFSGGNCTVTPRAVGTVAAGSLTGYTVQAAGSGCDGTLTGVSVGGILIADMSGPFTTALQNSNTIGHILVPNFLYGDIGFQFNGRSVSLQTFNQGGLSNIDLALANVYQIYNTATTISTATNKRIGQVFAISAMNTTVTLSNALFNLCTNADYTMQSKNTLHFVVAGDGLIREIGCASRVFGIQNLPNDAAKFLNGTGAWVTIAGGGMIYPPAGVANSTGSAWGTSYTTHGTIQRVQLSDNTGTTGNLLAFDANGNATNGPGSHGNASRVQLSDNTGIQGNLAAFDANGNVSDSTIPSGTASFRSNIQITIPTTSLAGNACEATPHTSTYTGVVAGNTFTTSFTGDPSGVVGWGAQGGLVLMLWPGPNVVSWEVCNQSPSLINGGSIIVNVGAR